MKYKIGSIIAAAAIFTTLSTSAQAKEVTVQKGDTLWGFSQEYGVSVESIKQWNNLTSDLIHPNDVLKMSQTKQVIVEKGDSLWKIAGENGVSIEEIMQWNQLSSELIHPGTELTIYSSNMNANSERKDSTSAPVPQPQSESKQTQKEPAEEAYDTVELKKADAGKELTVEATAYTASCNGCSGVTATGVDLNANPGAKVISVDPSVIPLGSKVYVEGYGYATAADTGGAINGNKIDVFIPSYDEAVQWGRKQVKVTVLE